MKKLLLAILLLSGFFVLAQEDTGTETISLNYDLEGLTINGKVGDKIRLENLNFVGGSDKLLQESEPILQELLGVMTDNPKLKIEIQGHVCCDVDDSWGTSRKRAKAIYTYLIKNGISKRRLSFKSFKGKMPLFSIPEENDEQRIANRRVEIEIIEN